MAGQSRSLLRGCAGVCVYTGGGGAVYLARSCPTDVVLICSLAYLVQAVRAAGKCDAVFKGFSDCVLKMGNNIAGYQQDVDDKRNLETICR